MAPPAAETLCPATDVAMAPGRRTSTLDEERREVFDSVLQSMRPRDPDADRIAARAFLLRHLARTERGADRFRRA